MAEYKISQKSDKQQPSGVRNFWAPNIQRRRLNKKTIASSVVAAVIVIGVGAVFASIRLRGQVVKQSDPSFPINGGTQAISIPKTGIYSIPTAVYAAVTTAITTKNPSLLGSYYASSVRIVITKSLINEVADASNAAAIISNGLSGATTPWNFNVPASDISHWQQGPDGQYFDGIDVIGISANGEVISIGFNTDGQIDSVFVAPVDTLTPPSGDSSSTDNNTTNSNTIPTPTDTNSTD